MKNKTLLLIIAGTAAALLLILGIRAYRRRPLRDELEDFVKGLHPTVQNRFRMFIREVENTGWKVRITSAHRGYAHALRIYNTYPEVRAINGYFIGRDYHFFGFAVDMVLTKEGKTLGLNNSKSEWEATGIRKIAKKHGLRWGIDFLGYRSPADDPVHFDYPVYLIDDLVAAAKKQYGTGSSWINQLEPTGDKGNRLSLRGVPTKEKRLKKRLKFNWADCESSLRWDQNACKS